jgi:hypothetical protein
MRQISQSLRARCLPDGPGKARDNRHSRDDGARLRSPLNVCHFVSIALLMESTTWIHGHFLSPTRPGLFLMVAAVPLFSKTFDGALDEFDRGARSPIVEDLEFLSGQFVVGDKESLDLFQGLLRKLF